MKRLILVVLLMLGLAAPAWGGVVEGMSAYLAGDYESALKEFLPLAEQGAAVAQYFLGLMYYKGQGVPQDYAEAAKWYRQAAEQGLAEAQSNLGVMYDQGKGVHQDFAEAVKWYRKSAEYGDAWAQTFLGFAYVFGQGVPQDYVQAHLWFSLAAAQGDQGAAEARDTVARRMTPEQIAEAQRLAREWKPKAAVTSD